MNESTISVIGLYRLPIDASQVEENLTKFGRHADAFRSQVTENWANAWIVVVAFRGSASALDFNAFAHGGDPTVPGSAQAPWLEEIIDETDGEVLAAFYLHYVNLDIPLYYGAIALNWPAPELPPSNLLRRIPYESPD